MDTKVLITFLGTMLGAIIGTPLIEWFKDRLGAQRSWKTKKDEIVVTLRFIIGYLDAFQTIKEAAFGTNAEAYPQSSRLHFQMLKQFNLTPVLEKFDKLSSLHPEDSLRSQAGQKLVEKLVVIISCFEQIKELVPTRVIPQEGKVRLAYFRVSEEDSEFYRIADKYYMEFQAFLIGVYAKRMAITPTSFLFDKEVTSFELGVIQNMMKEADS